MVMRKRRQRRSRALKRAFIEFARMGARARNKKLSPEQRSESARHAARARWDRVRVKQAVS